MNKKLLVMSIFALAFAACATHPEKVPEIDRTQLSGLKIEQLKPRTLVLSVENNRKINKTTGNTKEIENAVYAVIEDSLQRGGIKLGPSKNSFEVTINDCPNAPEGSECVLAKGELKTKAWKLKVEGTSWNGYSKEGSPQHNFGDVSEAYQGALKGMFQAIEEKTKKVEQDPAD